MVSTFNKFNKLAIWWDWQIKCQMVFCIRKIWIAVDVICSKYFHIDNLFELTARKKNYIFFLSCVHKNRTLFTALTYILAGK